MKAFPHMTYRLGIIFYSTLYITLVTFVCIALTIGFNPVAYSANEDMGMVTLTVGVQGQLGPGTTVSVDYRLLDDTAVGEGSN